MKTAKESSEERRARLERRALRLDQLAVGAWAVALELVVHPLSYGGQELELVDAAGQSVLVTRDIAELERHVGTATR